MNESILCWPISQSVNPNYLQEQNQDINLLCLTASFGNTNQHVYRQWKVGKLGVMNLAT